MGVLTVRLIKADNLKDADFLGKTDPYVKIELEQDNAVSTTNCRLLLQGQCFMIVTMHTTCCGNSYPGNPTNSGLTCRTKIYFSARRRPRKKQHFLLSTESVYLFLSSFYCYFVLIFLYHTHIGLFCSFSFSNCLDLQFRDKDYGTQISSTKQGERNPVWDETFTFNIPTLNNMVLSFRVYDDDIGSKDDKCGKCKVKLEHEDITADPKHFTKRIDFNLLSANGTLSFEISYE